MNAMGEPSHATAILCTAFGIVVFLVCIIFGNAKAQDPFVRIDPPWLSRDASGNAVVSGITFDVEESAAHGEYQLDTHHSSTCNPIGGCNYVGWDIIADGYAGRAPGGPTCASPGACPEWENKDTGHIWGSAQEKNVLWANFEVKNGFRFPGTGAHVDNLQCFQNILSNTGHTAALVNGIIKNSDDQNILFSEDCKLGTVIFHNVTVTQDAAFNIDCNARFAGESHACPSNNVLDMDPAQNADLWLVGFDVEMSTQDMNIEDNWANVILVDTSQDNLTFNGISPQVYADVEAAIVDHGEPAFLRVGCRGWATPPAGCINFQGPFPEPPPDCD